MRLWKRNKFFPPTPRCNLCYSIGTEKKTVYIYHTHDHILRNEMSAIYSNISFFFSVRNVIAAMANAKWNNAENVCRYAVCVCFGCKSINSSEKKKKKINHAKNVRKYLWQGEWIRVWHTADPRNRIYGFAILPLHKIQMYFWYREDCSGFHIPTPHNAHCSLLTHQWLFVAEYNFTSVRRTHSLNSKFRFWYETKRTDRKISSANKAALRQQPMTTTTPPPPMPK